MDVGHGVTQRCDSLPASSAAIPSKHELLAAEPRMVFSPSCYSNQARVRQECGAGASQAPLAHKWSQIPRVTPKAHGEHGTSTGAWRGRCPDRSPTHQSWLLVLSRLNLKCVRCPFVLNPSVILKAIFCLFCFAWKALLLVFQ